VTDAEKIVEKLKSATPVELREVLDFVEFLESKRPSPVSSDKRTLGEYFGVLKDSKAFAGDPVEIQRKLRDEWP